MVAAAPPGEKSLVGRRRAENYIRSWENQQKLLPPDVA